jgi:hypothetical protein
MSTNNNRDIWEIRSNTEIKGIIYSGYMQELTNKVTSMFDFKGLPETVSENFFKLSLVLFGECAILKDKKGEYYAVKGQRSGEPNAYYIPKGYVYANPAIGSETFENVKVNPYITIFYLTPFDETTLSGSGMWALINRTARTLADIDVSIKTAVKNSRIVGFCECDSDTIKTRLDEAFKKMRNGEDVFSVKSGFENEIKLNPFLTGANLPEIMRELVELRQFVLANFYHALGINSNYNLKRAQISNEEIKTNDDILIINTYEIIKQLKIGCDELNAKTGLNVSVDYSEPWKILRETEINNEDTEDTETENNEESEGEENEIYDNAGNEN